MRVLDMVLSERPRYDVVRRMRRLRSWVAGLGEGFDWKPYEGRGYFHWKLALPYALVSGPTARPALQSRAAQVLIDAARTLADRRPPGLAGARVAAIINLPDMFGSEVCVFFDEAYFRAFAPRDDEEQTWTPVEASLARRWDLRLPPGFGERGFATELRDFDFGPPHVVRGEVWMIGEV